MYMYVRHYDNYYCSDRNLISVSLPPPDNLLLQESPLKELLEVLLSTVIVTVRGLLPVLLHSQARVIGVLEKEQHSFTVNRC